MKYEAPSCAWCPTAIRAWRQGQIWNRGLRSRITDPNSQTTAHSLRVGRETRRTTRKTAIMGSEVNEGSTRLEEIIQLAKRMRYKKIGVATCVGFADLAQALCDMLENRGFGVVSVASMHGNMPEEEPWLPEFQDAHASELEAPCNPIVQAELLNAEGCEFNVAMGLCVGCDCVFFRYAKAPTTVLYVRDRVLRHDPAPALDFV